MNKSTTALMGLFLFASGLFAQNIDLNEKLPIDRNVKIGKLKNGLTYYIRNNGKPEDKVELRLVVNAGSVLETDRQVGLAHFMEHMNFNGTKNFEKNELVDYLQSIGVKFGADLNAYTSFNETVYILPIPSDDPEKLEKGFQIIEDWAHNATLTNEAIDDERGVVLEEYRLSLGGDKRMLKEYLPKLMHGSKYADRLPIGTKSNLENFDYQDVKDFYNDWYRPDLMAVVAVGDLSVEEMEKKIIKHFDGIASTPNAKKREEFDLPNHEETFISITTDKEAAFNRVQLMYKDHKKAKKVETFKDYRDLIVVQLFTTLLNNRLSELSNAPEPPFVGAGASYRSTFARTKNAYQCFALSSPEGLLGALKVMLEENKRVQLHGFLPSELDRARKTLLANIEKQFNDRDKMESSRIVREYVRNYLTQEPIPGIEMEFDLYKKLLPQIQTEEINALINDFIHDDNRVIILTGTEKEGVKKVSEEEVKALLKEVDASNIAAYEDEAVASSLIKNVPKAGSIASTDVNEQLGTTTLNLSNGLKLTYKKTDFKNDEILLRAYSPGGSSLYSDEELDQTFYANMFVSNTGIGGLSLTDMQKFMSGKIARVSPSIGNYEEGFSGSAAPKDIEIMFQMIHLYFTDLNKDEEAYKSNLSKMKGFLGNFLAMPNMYFREEIDNYRNKGNKRHYGFPTEERLDAANYDLAYVKYKERFANAADFHFYLVGNIEEESIQKYAKLYLASLPTLDRKDEPVYSDFKFADQYDKYVVKRGVDPKSNVQISWEEAVNYDEVNKLAVKALGEVLTIKLVEQLREEESGVYGVGAKGSLRKRPYSKVNFSISFPCGPENVDKLSAAALAEVKKLKVDGIQTKDLDKVKETLLVDHKEKLKTNRFWVEALLAAKRNESDPNRILEYEKKVNALTEAELQEIAVKYLDDNYFHAILMPEKEE